jgi:hypothetical protein
VSGRLNESMRAYQRQSNNNYIADPCMHFILSALHYNAFHSCNLLLMMRHTMLGADTQRNALKMRVAVCLPSQTLATKSQVYNERRRRSELKTCCMYRSQDTQDYEYMNSYTKRSSCVECCVAHLCCCRAVYKQSFSPPKSMLMDVPYYS